MGTKLWLLLSIMPNTRRCGDRCATGHCHQGHGLWAVLFALSQSPESWTKGWQWSPSFSRRVFHKGPLDSLYEVSK